MHPADFILDTMHGSYSNDYTPFPSRIFALLFLLANSPRPLVCLILCDYIALFVVGDKCRNFGLEQVVLLYSTLMCRVYFIHMHMQCMQGKKNISFIWFILKNSIPTIPALSAVTSFEIPGVIHPQRVRISLHKSCMHSCVQ